MAKLRARDNIPVFGWLALGGRCYICRLPIAKRYPVVELIVGLSFSFVCFAEIYQLSLPRQSEFRLLGPLKTPVIDLSTLLLAGYHAVVLSLSWACGLIRLDGSRLPLRLVFLSLGCAILPIGFEPRLAVVPWQAAVDVAWRPDGLYLDALMRILTAVVAATVLGRALVPAFCPSADLKMDPLGKSTTRLVDLVVVLALPSLVIGWQSITAVVIVASVFAALLQPILGWSKDALGCFSVCIPVAFSIQLIFWRYLHSPFVLNGQSFGTWLWPSESGLPWVILFWGLSTLLIPLWLRDFESKGPVRSSRQDPEVPEETLLDREALQADERRDDHFLEEGAEGRLGEDEAPA